MQFIKTNQLKSISKKPILVSYFPCLCEAPGYLQQNENDKFIKNINEFQNDMGNIQAVGWLDFGTYSTLNVVGKTGRYPIFLIKDAKDVCKHLKEWGEEDFTLVWEVKKNRRYSLVLLPNIDRTYKHFEQHQDDVNLISWAWSFNSKNPSNVDPKLYFKNNKIQTIYFTDIDNREKRCELQFQSFRFSQLKKTSDLYQRASCYIFKEN